MANSLLIPVSEYLATSYRPDCDYVDGELEERNLGGQDHSDLQSRLVFLLGAKDVRQYVRANPELRVQVTASRYRVPDVCIRRADTPSEQIVLTPPIVCIEILSPRDTVAGRRQRVREYLNMGVIEVWVLDPASRSAMIYCADRIAEQMDGTLTVPGMPVSLALAEVFAVLDEYHGS